MLHYTSENANLKDRLAKTEAALAEANYKIEQLNLKPISNGIVVEHEPQVEFEWNFRNFRNF